MKTKSKLSGLAGAAVVALLLTAAPTAANAASSSNWRVCTQTTGVTTTTNLGSAVTMNHSYNGHAGTGTWNYTYSKTFPASQSGVRTSYSGMREGWANTVASVNYSYSHGCRSIF